ncbi:MAG: hypothetical protein IJ493_06055 [Clostridia bacterium]|nr:hypothetical protein [Clostridia bacterium]
MKPLLRKHTLPALDPAESRNIVLHMSMEIMNCFTILFVGGTLWQGLLLHNGCTSTEIGILSAVGSLAQVAAMALNMGLSDRFRSPIRVMALSTLPIALFFALIGTLCCIGGKAFAFPVLLGCVILYYAAYGFRSIFAYKIPYLVIHMEHYGRLTAAAGLISNLFCIVVSMAIPMFLERVDYMSGMMLLYVICTVCAGLMALFNSKMRVIGEPPVSEQPKLRELFADRSVTHLAPANFLRGVSSGIIASLTLVASHLFELDSVALSLLVSLTTLGSVLGNLFYSLTGKSRWLSLLCLGASLTLLVLGPLSTVIGSWTFFAMLFVIIQIAYVIVNGTIPVMLAQFTPYRIVGGCTSLRMMETMAGSALSSWVTGLVLDSFTGTLPALLLMLTAGLTQLYCGVSYHRYYTRNQIRKEENYGRT